MRRGEDIIYPAWLHFGRPLGLREEPLRGQFLNFLSDDIAFLAYTNTMTQTRLTVKRDHNVKSTA
jgi:hypothetical protein